MEPITYAGMSTRQVDFRKAREELAAFLHIELADDVMAQQTGYEVGE